MVASFESELENEGYIWLKKLLSDDEVKNLRDVIFQMFDEREKRSSRNYSVNRMSASMTYWTPEIWKILFKEKLINALKTILEPGYSLIPDLHIQINTFGFVNNTICGIPIPNEFGWHTDAGDEAFNLDHLNPEYRLVKCGLYLQDNDTKYGGGIDIVPRSHKIPISSGFLKLDWKEILKF